MRTEAEINTISVRTRKDKDLGARPVPAFIEPLKTEIHTRAAEGVKAHRFC